MIKVPFVSHTPKITWQRLKSKHKKVYDLYRSPVEGGWLVTDNHGGMTFIPDEHHLWDGESYSIEDR